MSKQKLQEDRQTTVAETVETAGDAEQVKSKQSSVTRINHRQVQVGGHIVDAPVMLTVEEAHQIYRLSRQYIYQLAKSGKVNAILSGTKILIVAESLTNYLCSSIIAKKEPKKVNGLRQFS